MSEELKKILEDLHNITNKFSITGKGVSGNLKEGYIVAVNNPGGPAPVPEPP